MKHASTHAKLLVVALIWGIGWVAGRVAAQEIPPFLAGWTRYILVMICFLAYLKLSGKWVTPTKKQWIIIGWIGFFSTFLYQSFFMYGMKFTAAGDASLMVTFNPLFTALLAIPFLGEKFDRRLGIGLFLAISGVGIISLYSPNVDIPANERLWGDLMIAFSALAWAASSILMKRAMSGETPMTPLQITVWSSLAGLLIQTPPAIWEWYEFGFPTEASFEAWAWIAFLAIASTAISYVWFADGIRVIGASRTSLYVYLVPVFGILSGWLMLDEKLGLSLVASFILIVGGVLYAQWEPKQASSMESDSA